MASKINPKTVSKKIEIKDVTGKIPPQNVEAEQSILGALLIDKDAIVKIAESLKYEHFYR